MKIFGWVAGVFVLLCVIFYALSILIVNVISRFIEWSLGWL